MYGDRRYTLYKDKEKKERKDDVKKTKRIHGKTTSTRIRKKKNKYRGDTSDATTSSSLIVPIYMMLFDDFLPSKIAIFVVRK